MPDELSRVAEADQRYSIDAYLFVYEALAHTQKMFGCERHVTGRRLLEGIRDLALKHYGLMAKRVLNSWGVRTTDDFGAIVFNLVNNGLMSKTDEDSIEDFRTVYDFDQALVQNYTIPARPPSTARDPDRS